MSNRNRNSNKGQNDALAAHLQSIHDIPNFVILKKPLSERTIRTKINALVDQGELPFLLVEEPDQHCCVSFYWFNQTGRIRLADLSRTSNDLIQIKGALKKIVPTRDVAFELIMELIINEIDQSGDQSIDAIEYPSAPMPSAPIMMVQNQAPVASEAPMIRAPPNRSMQNRPNINAENRDRAKNRDRPIMENRDRRLSNRNRNPIAENRDRRLSNRNRNPIAENRDRRLSNRNRY